MKIIFVALLALAVVAMAEPVRKTDTCTVCKTVIGILEHWLKEGKTIEEIKALVNDM